MQAFAESEESKLCINELGRARRRRAQELCLSACRRAAPHCSLRAGRGHWQPSNDSATPADDPARAPSTFDRRAIYSVQLTCPSRELLPPQLDLVNKVTAAMADPFLSRPAPPRFKPSAPSRQRSHSSATASSSLAPSSSTRSVFDDATVRQAPPALTSDNLLQRLEALLVAKSQEIQLAGRLGESLLTQQAELETRIRELEQDASLDSSAISSDRRSRAFGHEQEASENGQVADDVRRKLESLESEMRQWEKENDEMYRAAGIVKPASDGAPLSASSATFDPPLQANGAHPVSAGPPSNRRDRNNAQHRSNDIEFAAEIGQSLLVEVRRLQVLLNERDEALREEREGREALEREREANQAALRASEEGVEKYKEENWNLELAVQELRSSHADAVDNAQRAESERSRLTKALATAREQHDAVRAEADRHVNTIETLRNKHETDMAGARKTAATLQREKTDLQVALDTAVTAANGRNIRRSVSLGQDSVSDVARGASPAEAVDEMAEVDEEEEGDDVFGKTSTNRPRGSILPSNGSPAPSLSGEDAVIPATANVDQLRAALAHRQRTIETLRTALHREKEARIRGRHESAADETDDAESSPVAARRAVRRGGHARRGLPGRRGGAHIPSKLARQLSGGGAPDDFDDLADEDGADEELASQDMSSGDVMETLDALPGLRDGPAKGSLASLDPAFAADMQFGGDDSFAGSILGSHAPSLRNRSSQDSLAHIRQRPTSGMFSSLPDLAQPQRVMVDASTMTEPVQTADMGVQVTPEPPVVLDVASQTEAAPVLAIGVQTDSVSSTTSATQTDALRHVDAQVGSDAPQHRLMHAVSTSSIATVSTPRAATSSKFAMLEGLRKPVAGDESDSVTETDGETDFEDAHESIGAPTPSVAITPSVSGRSLLKYANEDSDEEELSGMHTPGKSSRKPVAVPRPQLVDAGVQTEALLPDAVPEAADKARRDSSATFGGRATPLLATAGPVYVQTVGAERSLSPYGSDISRPDSMLSTASTATTLPPPVVKPEKPRGPLLSMPPPPSIPPPRNLSPRKPSSTTSSIHSVIRAPPRPSSPPPPDLLQRATSPTLLMPTVPRQATAAGTASTAASKRPRAAASTASLAPSQRSGRNTPHVTEFGGVSSPSKRPSNKLRTSAASTASFSSRRSRAHSVASSHTSEGEHTMGYGAAPPMPGAMGMDAGSTTDPSIIHAITQTMIGEFLYKYTRRRMTKGHSENRHKRYFWVHPYTRTLYWGSLDPSAQNVSQTQNKSVYIESVRQVFDPNPMPPGMHQNSLIIKTPLREMKITAPTRERHDMWYNAISYLVSRPHSETPTTPLSPTDSASAFSPNTLGRASSAAHMARLRSAPSASTPAGGRTSMYKLPSASDSRLPQQKGTLSPASFSMSRFGTASRSSRGRQSAASMLNMRRPETPAAEYLQHAADYGSPRSVRSYGGSDAMFDDSLEVVNAADISYDPDETLDDGFEGLENVRVCCGEHDVGRLSHRRRHSHGHSHLHELPSDQRPTSPSPSVRIVKASGSTVRSARRSIGSLWSAKFGEPEVPPLPTSARS